MKLLQVCNVGRIVGGTAACAWSITRAFPDIEHHLAVLSSITDDTAAAMTGIRLHRRERITNDFVRGLGCDAVILHNTAPSRCDRITTAWTLQYVHSRGPRAAADCTRYCSRWLADQCRPGRATEDDVLHQCVPRPSGPARSEEQDCDLVIGRICTPVPAKWPSSLVEFYSALAARHPRVRWEFVGCPPSLMPSLRTACHGRVIFHPAGWNARSHLARWDALLYHHPSLTESFGRTAAEAMRAGCVPIVDARGGFLEQVTRESGWLCSTTEDFQNAVDQLQESGRRRQMSVQAMRRADDLFSLAAFRRRLLGLWTLATRRAKTASKCSS